MARSHRVGRTNRMLRSPHRMLFGKVREVMILGKSDGRTWAVFAPSVFLTATTYSPRSVTLIFNFSTAMPWARANPSAAGGGFPALSDATPLGRPDHLAHLVRLLVRQVLHTQGQAPRSSERSHPLEAEPGLPQEALRHAAQVPEGVRHIDRGDLLGPDLKQQLLCRRHPYLRSWLMVQGSW